MPPQTITDAEQPDGSVIRTITMTFTAVQYQSILATLQKQAEQHARQVSDVNGLIATMTSVVAKIAAAKVSNSTPN